MTANIVFSLKFILIWCYSFSLSPFAQIAISTAMPNTPPVLIFYIFVLMIFLPDLVLIVSKGFRAWIKEGLEDADGSLNRGDVKDLVVHYASLNSLRVFVLESLMMMFYDVEIPFHYYVVPFFGSIGLSGFTILKNLYKAQ